MHGTHFLAEWQGLAPGAPLRDAPALRAACLQAVQQAGLRAVGELFHPFGGEGGVTGAVLLAESHLAIHTWPELDAVTLDLYVCNFSANNQARAAAVMADLQRLFAPQRVNEQRLVRGTLAGA